MLLDTVESHFINPSIYNVVYTRLSDRIIWLKLLTIFTQSFFSPPAFLGRFVGFPLVRFNSMIGMSTLCSSQNLLLSVEKRKKERERTRKKEKERERKKKEEKEKKEWEGKIKKDKERERKRKKEKERERKRKKEKERERKRKKEKERERKR